MELYPHQKRALELSRGRRRVAYYHDMGLGKTYTGAAKLDEMGERVNLVVCQHSKIGDWLEHFKANYPHCRTVDLTKATGADYFVDAARCGVEQRCVGVINYDLVFRRPALARCPVGTLLLDESSVIQNECAKRSKAVLSIKAGNCILLSGTPTGGRYERLWSQCRLLGWGISKEMFWNQYVDWEWRDDGSGRYDRAVKGYKNVERLKRKLAEHGAQFLRTEDVLDLPRQTFQSVRVPATPEYRAFARDGVVEAFGREFVGANPLTKMTGERRLCGVYNDAKMAAMRDLLDSTDGRLVVFYNFAEEFDALEGLAAESGRPVSAVNGLRKDLSAYEAREDSVTLVQYQAGAMGIDLQKSNATVFFTPPLGSELYEQSKKRIHRIGQGRACFYYRLTVAGSVEERIYASLAMRRDYSEALFERGA